MSDSAVIFLLLPGVFFAIILFIEVGHRLGKRYAAEQTEQTVAVFGTTETAIFALLGLLFAFTFSGAASRFDARRTLTVDEANAIGTAYLRVDLLPGPTQPALRNKFRRYTEARIAVYQALPDVAASDSHAARATALQSEIWTDAVAALKESPTLSVLVLNALNTMIDITTTRSIVLKTLFPSIVLATPIALTLVCSLLIGIGLPRTNVRCGAPHVLFCLRRHSDDVRHLRSRSPTCRLDPTGLYGSGAVGCARHDEMITVPG
jgi:hypothetical protein